MTDHAKQLAEEFAQHRAAHPDKQRLFIKDMMLTFYEAKCLSLMDENERLRGQIKQFGRHRADCNRYEAVTLKGDSPCTCGWSEVQQKLAEGLQPRCPNLLHIANLAGSPIRAQCTLREHHIDACTPWPATERELEQARKERS